jgi:DNA-binding response OmpR family regulator
MNQNQNTRGTPATHNIDKSRGAGLILILEDDTRFSALLKEFIESQGYHVDCVSSGVEGVLRVMGNDYDVILCDMVMPNVPGDMFYLAVERSKPHLCKRFVFMTGHRSDRQINDFLKKTGGVILWKPFPMQDLISAIETVIKSTRKQ